MNAIETNRATSVSLSTVAATGAPASTEATASLLPEPAPSGLDGTQDAMGMMYSLIAKQGQLSMASGEAGVTSAQHAEEGQAAMQQKALQNEEAQEAKEDTFWGKLESIAPDIAEYVGIACAAVGAAALSVATCGVGGVVTAAVVVALSASGILASKTKCFGADSGEIGAGLEIASAVVSFGATSASAIGGGVAMATSVADGVSGAADVAAGAATIVSGNQQADLMDATADVQQTTNAMNREQRMVEELVTGLKASQDGNQKTLQILAGASQSYGQSLALSAGKV